MKQYKKTKKGGYLTNNQKRMLPVIIIPLVVVALMIIIVAADHNGRKKASDTVADATVAAETMGTEDSAESGSEAETETEETSEAETEPAETDPADAFATDTFKRDSVPEILDLMKKYFQARAGADAAAMNEVYGAGEVSEADLQAQTARMRSNANYVQEFEHITTYVMEGTTSDSWLVYTVADIRFHTVSTVAPMVMWCYVTKDAEGAYHIAKDADLSENVMRFIDAANHSEAVRRLASDVNGKLKAALADDADLNAVYGVLRDGSPVWQEGESAPEVVVLDGTETTAADETTAAETAAAENAAAETQPQ